jgi:hypothetical protein
MTATVNFSPPLAGCSHPVPDVLWTVGDVQEARPDLTARQAWEVFKFAGSAQDSRVGVTWGLLMHPAEAMFGPACARRPA